MITNIDGYRITYKQSFELFEIYMWHQAYGVGANRNPIVEMCKYLIKIFRVNEITYSDRDTYKEFPIQKSLISLAEAKKIADKLIDKWSC